MQVSWEHCSPAMSNEDSLFQPREQVELLGSVLRLENLCPKQLLFTCKAAVFTGKRDCPAQDASIANVLHQLDVGLGGGLPLGAVALGVITGHDALCAEPIFSHPPPPPPPQDRICCSPTFCRATPLNQPTFFSNSGSTWQP